MIKEIRILVMFSVLCGCIWVVRSVAASSTRDKMLVSSFFPAFTGPHRMPSVQAAYECFSFFPSIMALHCMQIKIGICTYIYMRRTSRGSKVGKTAAQRPSGAKSDAKCGQEVPGRIAVQPHAIGVEHAIVPSRRVCPTH